MASYSTEVGEYLVVLVIRDSQLYIAEVVRSNPLVVKIKEFGPYSELGANSIVIQRKKTVELQTDDRNNTALFIKRMQKEGRVVVSGLRSLGVTDNKVHEILPG